MSNIIHLNGDPHEQIQRLLPWYANGTLDPAERDGVEAHLKACLECQSELEFDHAISMEMASMPGDADRGWAALQRRLDQHRAPKMRSFRLPQAAFLRRSVPLGWALSAQAAAVALMIGVARLAAPVPQPVYQALSAPPLAEPGNLIVMFRPDTTEQELRRILAGNNARLVDGPTVSDAYVLKVTGARRAAILARLRADRHILLAQPIDSDVRS